ncbi:predicted protein [Nematostella vectensis]|uniref:Interleukin-1 receptor-associated kinase 1-binding protein 1 homolog n=1 Tax=Nematostella vectensis TaxID=45351 RepID=A7SVU7_NEMVE|nr:interleukin-1 receptor-associated kinase 1-binding protein 1 [Nematostella vectensis]EDO32163.1 predicted protein [Nematostella vectensis]|eukprot:XP_001624263.1 predicted protein [Nematostella vectensis]
MSSNTIKWFNPAEVYAQFTTGEEPEKREKATTNDKQDRKDIQITESAELSLAPDKARVLILCSSCKESVEEVKTSVNRRVEYILQTLKSYRIKDTCYKINRILTRQEKTYFYETEIIVEFSDFLKCEEVSNLLVEKLDETVTVSPPVFYHSTERLANLRCQACVSAVKNAKNKALQVVQMFNQILGPPITIREESYEEIMGTPNEHPETSESQKKHAHSFHDKIMQATVTVNMKVFVSFEIREKAIVHKRKK